MHELSIALSILKTAEEEVKKVSGKLVSEIHLEIGKVSGVVTEALLFVWPQCTQETVLHHSKVIIEETDGKAKCIECGNEFYIENLFDDCPECASPFKEIIKGNELKIRKLIIQ